MSKLACRHALAGFDWSWVQSVLAYTPVDEFGEIDPSFLLASLPGSVRIDYVEPTKNAPFVSGYYDVVIVPVVGFDDKNNRIGRGGGWYDRLLAMHPESVSIGLAYGWSKVHFAAEQHDWRLTFIFTDETDAS